jgi:hypothetical protein
MPPTQVVRIVGTSGPVLEGGLPGGAHTFFEPKIVGLCPALRFRICAPFTEGRMEAGIDQPHGAVQLSKKEYNGLFDGAVARSLPSADRMARV